ncbi:hypothetical protein RSOLAG1IB_05208 [Rhizoctonia solani AG-1 IB]|uniref:Uncharacterized protein n=1 Tax=Thanatephorus cucumeris (strain AG1-IB / isolate 7/3/14) TaxID=1108050 RepID=A0A0B7G3V1_THACB|nr:hypothetical protein RSOLAG1IB_05208 [Rhizoctonia solani AG-1 IB]
MLIWSYLSKNSDSQGFILLAHPRQLSHVKHKRHNGFHHVHRLPYSCPTDRRLYIALSGCGLDLYTSSALRARTLCGKRLHPIVTIRNLPNVKMQLIGNY